MPSSFVFPRIPASTEPVGGVSTRDVVVDVNCDIWARLFVPIQAQEDAFDRRIFPVLVFFHGGGFVSLHADSSIYDRFCRRVAKDFQVIAVSVNYRKAPRHKYPTAYEDGFKAVKWLQAEHGEQLPPSADVSQCILMGDSAGANIVHHVGVRAAECAQHLKPLSIVGHVLLLPYFGGEERTSAELSLVDPPVLTVEGYEQGWKAFLPAGGNRDHPACRVFGPQSKDLSHVGLPPSLVVIAEIDVCRDWGRRYCQGLEKLGKQVQMELFQGAYHGFHMDPAHPQVPLLFENIKQFIHRVTTEPLAAVQSRL